MRNAILLGCGALSCLPAAVAAHPLREAHIIRPTRGDVMMVHGELSARRTSLYVAPVRNWRYRTVAPGERLPSAFYGANYVVSDPARLPVARGSRRWVRYGDDLLLVNIRSGRVIRVVANRYG